jgi:hypothetical protein
MASEIEPLNGKPALIDALESVLNAEEELFGWAHNQEHYFQSTEYCGLVSIFDKQVGQARERRRPVLDRIFELGGQLDGVVTDPQFALGNLLDRLVELHARCQAAYQATEDPDDYVTREVLTGNQESLEHLIQKIRKKLAKKAIIGEQLWLDRLV